MNVIWSDISKKVGFNILTGEIHNKESDSWKFGDQLKESRFAKGSDIRNIPFTLNDGLNYNIIPNSKEFQDLVNGAQAKQSVRFQIDKINYIAGNVYFGMNKEQYKKDVYDAIGLLIIIINNSKMQESQGITGGQEAFNAIMTKVDELNEGTIFSKPDAFRKILNDSKLDLALQYKKESGIMFENAILFRDIDPVKATKLYEEGIKLARQATANTLQIALSNLNEVKKREKQKYGDNLYNKKPLPTNIGGVGGAILRAENERFINAWFGQGTSGQSRKVTNNKMLDELGRLQVQQFLSSGGVLGQGSHRTMVNTDWYTNPNLYVSRNGLNSSGDSRTNPYGNYANPGARSGLPNGMRPSIDPIFEQRRNQQDRLANSALMGLGSIFGFSGTLSRSGSRQMRGMSEEVSYVSGVVGRANQFGFGSDPEFQEEANEIQQEMFDRYNAGGKQAKYAAIGAIGKMASLAEKYGNKIEGVLGQIGINFETTQPVYEGASQTVLIPATRGSGRRWVSTRSEVSSQEQYRRDLGASQGISLPFGMGLLDTVNAFLNNGKFTDFNNIGITKTSMAGLNLTEQNVFDIRFQSTRGDRELLNRLRYIEMLQAGTSGVSPI